MMHPRLIINDEKSYLEGIIKYDDLKTKYNINLTSDLHKMILKSLSDSGNTD